MTMKPAIRKNEPFSFADPRNEKTNSGFKRLVGEATAAFYQHKKRFFFKTYKQLEMFFKSVSEFGKIRETFLGEAGKI